MKYSLLSLYCALIIGSCAFYTVQAQAQTASPVIISEVQISGKTASDDFIELYNQSDTIINISKYRLRYKNSSGTESSIKEIDADTCIAPHEHYLWSHEDIGANTTTSATLAQNYSIALFIPKASGDIILDSVSWGGGAHTFDGSWFSFPQSPGTGENMIRNTIDNTWLPTFSTQPTPAKGLTVSCPVITAPIERQAQEAPPKADIPKNIYPDIPSEFSVKDADDANAKYSWNFGDGHTSRLAQTTHTYDHVGTYTLTLTATSAAGKSITTFPLEVKKFPKQKVALMDISPNPFGTDTGNEYIKVLNTGKKKIDLSGWSIATGTVKKKLTNHPIREKLTVKAGKEAIITQEVSTFSLPNKEGFIELRQPNGKAIDTIRYTQPQGGIAENRHYRRTGKKQWIWVREDASDPNIADKDSVSSAKDTLIATDTLSAASTDALLNAIDKLSTDELAFLRTRIEEKLALANQANAKTPDETVSVKTDSDENDENTGIAPISTLPENDLPYRTQSLLAEKHNQTMPSLLVYPFPSDIAVSAFSVSSLSARETLTRNHSEQPLLHFLQSINQALHSVTEWQ